MAPNYKMRNWQILVLIVWALWWGGLSFYAIIVVPIGTEQIGSVAQGFVTQRVTQWHNALAVLMTLVLAAQAYWFSSRMLWLASGLLAILTALLLAGHAVLTTQMDFNQQTVESSFYSQHAIYLWITAAEWFLGLLLPWLLLREPKTYLKVCQSEKSTRSLLCS